eukprot:scaffold1302_cov165-Ochromonas_danica.AAC.4
MTTNTGAATCSHQDPTRQTVSVTAHTVAYLRGMDPIFFPHNPLFQDPYALALGGEVGKKCVLDTSKKLNQQEKEKSLFFMGVRTRKIDDSLDSILANHPQIKQIVTLGAGLDTRPWRLPLPSLTAERKAEIQYFELDFPEVLGYKLNLLKQEGAESVFHYHAVEGDLSLEDWSSQLVSHGFDPSLPTVWLLEGLTSYLTLEENEKMFTKIRGLSSNGSHLVATFVTPDAGKRFNVRQHRYMADDPLGLMRRCGGWEGEVVDFVDIAATYGRPFDSIVISGGYLIGIVCV